VLKRQGLLFKIGSATKKPVGVARHPVIIDCISALDAKFSNIFRETLAAVDLDLPVLVELKRATVGDMRGLAAIVDAIRERRAAGGHIALMSPPNRWSARLRWCGLPDEWVVEGGDAAERRRIILAHMLPKP